MESSAFWGTGGRVKLELVRIEATSLREAFAKLKDLYPDCKAILMGTRRSDPKACKSFLLLFHYSLSIL